MLTEDDKRFYELFFKQTIHEKRKAAVAKYPERVYDRSENLRNSGVKPIVKTTK